jgi:hypothetical protein
MPSLNLNEAAKICHKSKSTVLEAIRNGRLSAIRNDKNEWQIDPAELFRVYPYKIENEKTEQPNSEKTEQENRNRTAKKPQSNNENLKEILEIERAERKVEQFERERERKQLEETIAKLWQRLEAEAEERQKLTKLITHQQESPVKTDDHTKENKLWKKIFRK